LPTYEYMCSICDYKFEVFHGMTAETLVDCPRCHESSLIKLIGMGSCVIIKGTQTPCLGGRCKKSKSGDKNKSTKQPWWRKDRPLNKNILSNPQEYVRTGKVIEKRGNR